jgi:hypothetical protein
MMNLDFSESRWERTVETYDAWWRGELDRPLIALVARDRDPGRPEPDLPYYRFASMYDPDVSAEAIADRWLYELECCRFLGDAFPHVHPNFGPGSIAAFLGLDLVNGEETVWFHCKNPAELPDLSFRIDEDNAWLRRCLDVIRAMAEQYRGMVQIAMPDIGGNLDILSSFRPSELLLLDLYDYPDDVKRLTWEAHEAWWHYYELLNGVLRPANRGYTAWTPLLSATPYYMLQCDFSYMIGPDMFDEFVRPELVASCLRLGNPFYHMDGPGQIPHLDSLLSIPELKGVQWVPGAGQPGPHGWPEIYERIREKGRFCHVVGHDGGIRNLEAVADVLGGGRGLYYFEGVEAGELGEVSRIMERFGLDENRP